MIAAGNTSADAGQGIPATHNATAPPVVHLSLLQKMCKHRVNSYSMAGGSVLMLASGLHLAWVLWRLASIYETWTRGHSASMHLLVLYSWFLTAILGSIVGAAIVNIWRTTIIYAICGGILSISGILFIALNDHYTAILIGRMLAGVAHGILYVTLVSHYADNTIAEMRGRSVCLIAVLINLAAVIVAVFNLNSSETLNLVSPICDQVIGIYTLLFAIIGLTSNYFLTYNSVLFSLRHGQEQDAVSDLLKLRKESTVTPSIRNELDDMKQMLNEARTENSNIFSNGNIRPLLLVTMIRLQAFLTSNSLINMVLIGFAQTLLGSARTFVGPLFLVSFRLAASLVLARYSVPRKWFLTPSGGIAAIVLVIFGILLRSVYLNAGFYILMALFQLLAGFGIDTMCHVITSEAFPINKRAWSIAFATSMENILQLAATVIMYYFLSSDWVEYIIVFGSALLIALLAGALHFFLPETYKLPIRQCQEIHRGPSYRMTGSHEVKYLQDIE